MDVQIEEEKSGTADGDARLQERNADESIASYSRDTYPSRLDVQCEIVTRRCEACPHRCDVICQSQLPAASALVARHYSLQM